MVSLLCFCDHILSMVSCHVTFKKRASSHSQWCPTLQQGTQNFSISCEQSYATLIMTAVVLHACTQEICIALQHSISISNTCVLTGLSSPSLFNARGMMNAGDQRTMLRARQQRARQHLFNCMAGAVVFISEWNEARSEWWKEIESWDDSCLTYDHVRGRGCKLLDKQLQDIHLPRMSETPRKPEVGRLLKRKIWAIC